MAVMTDPFLLGGHGELSPPLRMTRLRSDTHPEETGNVGGEGHGVRAEVNRRKDRHMTGVRVLVGTRKGAFTLSSDGTRKAWTVDGPHFGGWEIYHVNGSTADPDRLYASASGGWFGQVIHRSDDGGSTWTTAGNDFTYVGEVGEHLWYDGTPRPFEFKRIWHIEPSRDDPDTVYAGAEDAALYISQDGGHKWTELTALRQHKTAPTWQPGAGGMCLHTIILDPANKDRIYLAI